MSDETTQSTTPDKTTDDADQAARDTLSRLLFAWNTIIKCTSLYNESHPSLKEACVKFLHQIQDIFKSRFEVLFRHLFIVGASRVGFWARQKNYENQRAD